MGRCRWAVTYFFCLAVPFGTIKRHRHSGISRFFCSRPASRAGGPNPRVFEGGCVTTLRALARTEDFPLPKRARCVRGMG
jgi:hypothetical protein